jgi:RNA-directed DNA polymerase
MGDPIPLLILTAMSTYNFMDVPPSKLGSARYQAILTGLSRKSYWHPVAGLREGSLRLAKTLSTNMGLSKAFLGKQGLVSIRTLWIQIHYPAKAS